MNNGRMIVALDAEMLALYRAWCADEINYALSHEMDIKLVFHTVQDIVRIRDFQCNVEQCKARPVDKQRIINKVHRGIGVPSFNEKVTMFVQDSATNFVERAKRRATESPNVSPAPSPCVTPRRPFVRVHSQSTSPGSEHLLGPPSPQGRMQQLLNKLDELKDIDGNRRVSLGGLTESTISEPDGTPTSCQSSNDSPTHQNLPSPSRSMPRFPAIPESHCIN